jgi:tartrate dehydrogenase/decarboxylase / D-malate dehydrogenase
LNQTDKVNQETYRIAVIPGDGIGKEIIPEGLKVLNAVSSLYNFHLDLEFFPWGGENYLATGEFMPANALEILETFNAIYFGAVGHPKVDDTLPALHFTFKIRKSFHQYVNFRPVCLLPGFESPLKVKKTEEVDFVIIRENTEGEFAEIGSIVRPEKSEGFAIQTSLFTRFGIERIARYAFQLARSRRGKLTYVTKSNTLTYGLLYWDNIIEEVGLEYPDVEREKLYVDAAAMHFVLHPQRFDVVLSTNLFGDILSDLGAAILGSLGLGPSGNINPEKQYPSMFEPIHGSAPDIAGLGIANPIGTIWSGALMLDHLGEKQAAQKIVSSISEAFTRGLRPKELGGMALSSEIGDSIVECISVSSQ